MASRCFWSQDFGNNKLNILRVYSEREFAPGSADEQAFFRALMGLLGSCREAAAGGLKRVTLWLQDLPGLDEAKPDLLEKVAAHIKADIGYDAEIYERKTSWPMGAVVAGSKGAGRWQWAGQAGQGRQVRLGS